ncbi:MAG: DUF2905 family protein [Microgenomates group bacterium]
MNFFVLIGIIFIFIGLVFNLFQKIGGFPLLPGDILIQKENFTFYFPLTTSIIISLILTLIFSLIR